MQHREFTLQQQVSKYLKYQYPTVMFLSDTVANLKLTETQKKRNKSIQCQNFKCPDILILEPNEDYKGLFIELKIDTPFKKNGEIKASKNDHLKNQLKTITELNSKGYYACFSWSFDMTKKIIDTYFKKNK